MRPPALLRTTTAATPAPHAVLPTQRVRRGAPAARARREAVCQVVRGLTHPDVRAMAALVASPSLIAQETSPVALLDDGWRQDMLIEGRQWLAALDADPGTLTAHLAQSNARQLGRYAEALWQFWLARLPGAQIHAAGLAVKDGAAVRGEFDFIVALPGMPGVQHLETGYKFFLFDPAGTSGRNCVGPHPADRLDRKWRHMVDAQLPLSQTSLGRAALPAALADRAITPRACLQGYMFYPFGHLPPALPTLAPDHARGWWARFDAAASLPAWTALARAWTVLPKLRWIAPAMVAAGEVPPMSGAQIHARLTAHFATSRQGQLLCGLAPQRNGRWHEAVRVFIVHPEWPGA